MFASAEDVDNMLDKEGEVFLADPEVKQCRKLIKEWAKNSFSRDGLVELSFDSWCREYGHKLQL